MLIFMQKSFGTEETDYKNIVGSRIKCSYNRYVLKPGVLITDIHYRNVGSSWGLVGQFGILIIFARGGGGGRALLAGP